MTEKTKLKPCPFCGQDSACFANAGFGFIVKCRKCGTKTDVQNTTEEAATFWNERKPLSDIVPSNSIEFLVKFTRALADILAENKRLREALEIYKTALADGLRATGMQDSFWSIVMEADGKVESLLKGGEE